jgi:dihydroorotate dehydrogenase electron transfer subunit
VNRPAGASRADRSHRGTIFVEEAEVLANERHPAGQHVVRMRSAKVAERAAPGSFVHLRCGPELAMRRPMSVMRTDPAEGWFEILFKEVGAGTRLLGGCERGDRLSVLGPIGRGFAPSPDRPRRLLLGGGVGIPPILFLAERLAASRPVVLMGSEVPFPFDLRRSALPEAGLPPGAALRCLEEAGIPSRTASRAGLPGCFDGLVTDLARGWLKVRSLHERVGLFACGPEPMLRAVAELGREFGVPSQLALEEHMACGTGGCAGCNVLLQTPDGPAMKRVCVDGPVFDGASVFGA